MTTISDLSDLLQVGIGFGTIFADPPWPEQGGGRIKRGADCHYPLMKIADIIAMRNGPAARQAELAPATVWCTNNYLSHMH